MKIHALRKKTVNPVELLPHRINPDVLNQFAENEFKKVQAIYSSIKNSANSLFLFYIKHGIILGYAMTAVIPKWLKI